MIPIDVTYNYLNLSRDDVDISHSVLLVSIYDLCHFLYPCGSGWGGKERRGLHDCLTDILFITAISRSFDWKMIESTSTVSKYLFNILLTILQHSLHTLFPNLYVCSTSLLKTLWEKEKLLTTSNFSFSHSVFYQ